MPSHRPARLRLLYSMPIKFSTPAIRLEKPHCGAIRCAFHEKYNGIIGDSGLDLFCWSGHFGFPFSVYLKSYMRAFQPVNFAEFFAFFLRLPNLSLPCQAAFWCLACLSYRCRIRWAKGRGALPRLSQKLNQYGKADNNRDAPKDLQRQHLFGRFGGQGQRMKLA